MMPRRRSAFSAISWVGLLAFIGIACGGGTAEVSPWLFCTTNPCQPLALIQVPTPPALSNDASFAAACVISEEDGEGILLWHTDWDPLEAEGMCVSQEEAEDLGADISKGDG